MLVPVLDIKMRPLMPTSTKDARFLLDKGLASAYWSKLGIFCIVLKKEVSIPQNERIVCGIDPGSSFEGWSVVSLRGIILNGMSEAPHHIKKAVEQRHVMRRARRHRKCWRRPSRFKNRLRNENWIPPSTFARWNAKIRILDQLLKIIPITDVSVEDISAVTKKGKKNWNKNFSPIETGKQWFYNQIKKRGLNLEIYKGHETKARRDFYQLKKSTQKDEKSFNSHAVDAFVLAAVRIGYPFKSLTKEDKKMFYWTPIRVHRRQLHILQPAKGGERKRFGGTRSLGFSKGTLVRDKNDDIKYTEGYSSKNRITLCDIKTGKRITQNAKPEDLKVLTRISFRSKLI